MSNFILENVYDRSGLGRSEKMSRSVNVRAKRTTRSFRITLARALSGLRWLECGWILFSNQTVHVLKRDSFSARVRSAGVGNARLSVLLSLTRHNKTDKTPSSLAFYFLIKIYVLVQVKEHFIHIYITTKESGFVRWPRFRRF